MSPAPNSSGSLQPMDAALVGTLPALVRRLRSTRRHVDYTRAEIECEALAAALLDAYPRSELRGFSARGIPRGGLIVLGMLSYLLDLRSEQFADAADESRPLLLVDDCALSGARLHRALQAPIASRIVFAHLYSHPDLRRAVVEREAKVELCLAAADLTDHAREIYREDYDRWLAEGRRRLGAERYWLGLPDLLSFSWSEPDRPIWNPVSGSLETGWRLLPPHLCLKARAELGPPPVRGEAATWRVAESVATAVQDDRVWLYSMVTDRVFSLSGVGAEMWRVLAAWGSVEVGAEHLAGLYEVSPDTLRDDLVRFAGELVRQGLLEPAAG